MREKNPITLEEKLSYLRELREQAVHSASEDAVSKQHAKGKLTARERVEKLLDPGSFEELDTFVRHRTHEFDMDRKRPYGDAVVTGYGPDVDPVALGYRVTGFVTLEIRQVGGHDPVAERLAGIPEVLEVHTITGPGDMLCRVVARTNSDLQWVIDAIVAVAGVVRASTVIALATPVPYRVLPLVRASAAGPR